MAPGAAVILVNDAIAVWESKADFACSMHAWKMERWLDQRRRRKLSCIEVISGECDWDGSSGLFAVKAAIEHGFDRIVLAGIPMTAEGQHFLRPWSWDEWARFWAAWGEHREEISPYVRSMSGRTRDMLGAPTEEWLNDGRL